jgi:magnesium transporter
LHAAKPNFRWLLNAVRKEFVTSVMLGAGCALLVGVLVSVWQRDLPAAAAIAISVFGAMITACLLGVLVPSLLRALKLDPKIASGPLTLAAVDVATLAWYFGTAFLVLPR